MVTEKQEYKRIRRVGKLVASEHVTLPVGICDPETGTRYKEVIIDPRRLSKYVTLEELYECISILRNTDEIDEKAMLETELTYLQEREKELKQNQERQVEIDKIMIERKL